MSTKEQKPKERLRRKRLSDSRLSELLDIAATVFIREGYHAASLNEIARLANASKPTLYARFSSKEALFLAVIERRMQTISEQVTHFSLEEPIADALRTFSLGLLKFALSGDQVALIRMISMESRRYPGLARRYYESGPRRGELALAQYCEKQIERGHLKSGNVRSMAQQFINLIVGSPVRWFVLGFDTEQQDEHSVRRHVEDAIHVWLAAYGIPK